MKNGGALSVKTHSSNNSIAVSFINTGSSISEINLESLFESLYLN
jgi:hypothetical protein